MQWYYINNEFGIYFYFKTSLKKLPKLFYKVDYLTKSQWTFEKILNSARTLSATLQVDFGLLKGQVVALALPNSAEFFVSLLAVSRCGGVSSFVNPSYTTRIHIKNNCIFKVLTTKISWSLWFTHQWN